MADSTWRGDPIGEQRLPNQQPLAARGGSCAGSLGFSWGEARLHTQHGRDTCGNGSCGHVARRTRGRGCLPAHQYCVLRSCVGTHGDCGALLRHHAAAAMVTVTLWLWQGQDESRYKEASCRHGISYPLAHYQGLSLLSLGACRGSCCQMALVTLFPEISKYFQDILAFDFSSFFFFWLFIQCQRFC